MESKKIFRGFDLTAIEESKRETIIHSMLGDTAALEALLRNDAGLANCTWGYFTPLHFAVRSGNTESVKLLLEYGADVTKHTQILGWQDDPLTKAKDRGYQQIVDILEQHLAQNFQTSPAGNKIASWIKEGQRENVLRELDHSPELVRSGDERGNTPLHWAVLTRQIGLIEDLLRRGADIQAKRSDGAMPIHLAIHGDYWFRAARDLSEQAMRNQWFLVGFLVACGAEYDIWAASTVGDSVRVASLLHTDPKLVNAKNSVDRRPLSYAAKYGNANTVKLLLDQGADPNAEERDAPQGSALWAAVAGNHEECARLLLERGADPNSSVESGANPVSIAMSNGNDLLMKLLYTYGASVNLDAACWMERIDLVGEILKANPSLINAGGDYGPLCMAAGSGHTDIVRMLIRGGADLNAPWYANNFMGYAIDSGLEMVRLLLESGADANNANWVGVSYLHKAAWLGNLEFAKLLIEFGAELNVVDEESQSTPLGWAAKYGKTELVRFLLDKGANPRLPEHEKWAQPLEWAERRGHKDIITLLSQLN
ncbi:ankyrin repeat domain-containing protein [Paenibacillus sepulcri]|uniref:Ankyrin repeat domain-containing protein n=1 Tax=Paenibacillus sepulcri TaxID=359917 RepID=A0ABS7BUZ9_9BACL|nr:ankyrin repeat domain-containing protein [Paenibacillus sepulcri]